MKKRNGFTLIELLAVIVILAVIALIATPLIMNTINDAKKGICKSNGHEYIRIVETTAVENLMFGGKSLDGTYTIKNGDLYDSNNKLVLDVEMKGDIPKAGMLVIENNLVIEGDFSINECELAYDGETVTVEGLGNTEIVVRTFKEGDPVYFNPESGIECNPNDAISETGTNTGCMKWYVLNVNSDNTVDLILDHNTIGLVGLDETLSSTGITDILELAKKGLENTTSTWSMEARLPSGYEIIGKLPLYTELPEGTEINKDLYDSYKGAYNSEMNVIESDPNMPSEDDYITLEEGLDEVIAIFDEYDKKAILPNYLWADTIKKFFAFQTSGNSGNFDDMNSNSTEFGFITSTKLSPEDDNSYPWTVEMMGSITIIDLEDNPEGYINDLSSYGVRPVINVNSDKLTIPEEVKVPYKDGYVVYFNPNTGTLCDINDAKSIGEVKDGCMKWYVFGDTLESTTVNMILDHNTTINVQYNSDGGSEMKEVALQLAEDTKNWKSNIKKTARLITAKEVADIVGKENFSNASSYATEEEMMADVFRLEAPNGGVDAEVTLEEGQGKYKWLYNHLVASNLLGGIGNMAPSLGYWTESPFFYDNKNHSWGYWELIQGLGPIETDSTSSPNMLLATGIRPVITISKEIVDSQGKKHDRMPTFNLTETFIEKEENVYVYDGARGTGGNNWLWYAGHLWRIMKVDTTQNNRMTLISAYPMSVTSWGSSNIDSTYVNNWFNNVFIPSLDTDIQNALLPMTYKRHIYENGVIVYDEISNAKVRLLTEREFYEYGGGLSFLNIDDVHWTADVVTPGYVTGSNISDQGGINIYSANDVYSIRPVIEVANLTINSGSGTLSDPYIVQNTNATKTTDIEVGEYVSVPKADGSTYLVRVIKQDSYGTKVSLNGFYSEDSDISFMFNTFGQPKKFSTDSYIYQNTLTNFKNTLDLNYFDSTLKPFNNSTYAMTDDFSVVKSTTNTDVGLPSLGEMLTANDLDMLLSTLKVPHYVDTSKVLNHIFNNQYVYYYFTMNDLGDDLNVFYITGDGSVGSTQHDHAVRPTWYIKSGNIISGTGTINDPYKLK